MIKSFTTSAFEKIRLASAAKEIFVWDLTQDAMLKVPNMEEALQIARKIGWIHFDEAIFLSESGEKNYKSLKELFGPTDLSEQASKYPGWEKPEDESDILKWDPYKPPSDSDTISSLSKHRALYAGKWNDRELAILKDVYLRARDAKIPHNLIYRKLVEHIPHPYSGIKQKLEALYQHDESLSKYKYESWNKEKILSELEKLYTNKGAIARKLMPPKLEYQIANHSLPKAITRGFEVYFDSFDYAVAEMIAKVGYARNEAMEIDKNKPLADIAAAHRYYRHNEKINNPWTRAEIVELFKKAHEAGLPLTKSFFTSHPEVYKPLLDVSRSLDALRSSIQRMGDTWGEIVIEAVPDYKTWYSDTGKSNSSMGELRVKRFLDLNKIKYRSTTRQDKIAVIEPEVLEAGYKHFLPDLLLLDQDGNTIALVEVYGAIADSGAAEGELAQKYKEKIEAKEKVYKNLPIGYIAIHDNQLYGSDLGDDKLKEKFAKFLQSTIDDLAQN